MLCQGSDRAARTAPRAPEGEREHASASSDTAEHLEQRALANPPSDLTGYSCRA